MATLSLGNEVGKLRICVVKDATEQGRCFSQGHQQLTFQGSGAPISVQYSSKSPCLLHLEEKVNTA